MKIARLEEFIARACDHGIERSISAPRRGGQDSDIYCNHQDSDVSVQQRTGIRITMHKNKQTAAQERKVGGETARIAFGVYTTASYE